MTDRATTESPWGGAWLTILVLAVCATAFAVATGFVPATTRYFPLIVSAACVCIALLDLGMRVLISRQTPTASSETAEDDAVNAAASAPPAAILKYAAWFFGFLVGIWLVSLVVASGLFVAAFLWREAKTRWWTALISGLIVIGLVILAGNIFYIRWPASLFDPLKPLLR